MNAQSHSEYCSRSSQSIQLNQIFDDTIQIIPEKTYPIILEGSLVWVKLITHNSKYRLLIKYDNGDYSLAYLVVGEGHGANADMLIDIDSAVTSKICAIVHQLLLTEGLIIV